MMSSWNQATNILKSVDLDTVETANYEHNSWNNAVDLLKSFSLSKGSDLTSSQLARLKVDRKGGSKALTGETLTEVEGDQGEGLVTSRPGKLTISSTVPGQWKPSKPSAIDKIVRGGSPQTETVMKRTKPESPFKPLRSAPATSPAFRGRP